MGQDSQGGEPRAGRKRHPCARSGRTCKAQKGGRGEKGSFSCLLWVVKGQRTLLKGPRNVRPVAQAHPNFTSFKARSKIALESFMSVRSLAATSANANRSSFGAEVEKIAL